MSSGGVNNLQITLLSLAVLSWPEVNIEGQRIERKRQSELNRDRKTYGEEDR